MSSDDNKQPHDQGYHDHENHGMSQGRGWEMHQHQHQQQQQQQHQQQHMGGYPPYAREMSPRNMPPHHPGAQYGGGQMMHLPSHGGGGGGSGHHMMGQGSGVPPGGGDYVSYPPSQHHAQMIHPSYSFPPHGQQQHPPSHQQVHSTYYSHQNPPPQPHGGYYQPQYHPHPSQYAARNSPHLLESEEHAAAQHAAYYGAPQPQYGGPYMDPHHHHQRLEGQPHPPPSYGMMHHYPGGMHPEHHYPQHHAGGMEMARSPHHHGGGNQRGVSFEPSEREEYARAETEQRRLSYPSAVKAGKPEDATITSGDAPSPPDIPPPPTSASGILSALTERESAPTSPEPPLAESHRHGNREAKARSPEKRSSPDKKQTLDTASVLLAFSSTKKQRPSSETSMMDDNDSKGSFPTLPTEPSFSSMISEPPSDHIVVPTVYPKRLTTPDDEEKLNQLHCFMRSELLEIIVIEAATNAKAGSAEAKNVPTSSDPQMIGRVGLRCVFCGMSQDGGRSGPSMSVFYPRTVSEIYRLVTSWKRCHLSKCRHLPPKIRQQLDGFKEMRARGKTSYWVDSAHAIGLVDIPTKIGGVRFQTDPAGNIQSAIRPASQAQSLTSADSKPPSTKEEETLVNE